MAVAAIVSGALAWLEAPLVVRVVPASLLVAFLPGFAVTNAFVGDQLGRAERLLLSVALSLVVVIVAGLVMNVSPWGLVPQALTAVLVGVAVVASLLAYLTGSSRRPLPSEARQPLAARLRGPGAYPLALFALGGALTTCALVLAAFGAANQPVARFTELWAFPRDDFATVEVGIRNLEAQPMSYRVEIRTGDRLVSEWGNITLSAAEDWIETLDVAAIEPLEGDLTVRLYDRGASAEPYREVVIRESVLDGS